MDTLELGRRFIEAAGDGDVEAATACFRSDAEIWHNYDGETQTVQQNMALLAWMARACTDRRYEIHRMEEIDGGYLQQHTLHVTMNDGTKASTEAIAIVLVSDGLITRIEEYLDPTPLNALAGQELR